jgi:regulator of protease activity HflC (stomatin/prohibitin superfamily)
MVFLNPLFLSFTMKSSGFLLFLLAGLIVLLFSCKKKQQEEINPGVLQLAQVKVGSTQLNLQGINVNIPVDSIITIVFNGDLDAASLTNSIQLKKE